MVRRSRRLVARRCDAGDRETAPVGPDTGRACSSGRPGRSVAGGLSRSGGHTPPQSGGSPPPRSDLTSSWVDRLVNRLFSGASVSVGTAGGVLLGSVRRAPCRSIPFGVRRAGPFGPPRSVRSGLPHGGRTTRDDAVRERAWLPARPETHSRGRPGPPILLTSSTGPGIHRCGPDRHSAPTGRASGIGGLGAVGQGDGVTGGQP